MSSTNENDGTLIPNEGTNTGSENSGENNNETGAATSPGNDDDDKKGGMTAENSGGTPHKGNRPKPDVGVGTFGLR